MKKEYQYIIPARPATKATRKVVLCDMPGCGQSAERQNYGGGGGTCVICKRDVCKQHKKWDHTDPGDYPDTFCYYCDDLRFNVYDQLFNAEEVRHEDAIGELWARIKQESLKRKGENE